MADKAHILTDKKLEQMEKRLSAIYSTAQKDIQKKADEYFDKFKKADAERHPLFVFAEGDLVFVTSFIVSRETISYSFLLMFHVKHIKF